MKRLKREQALNAVYYLVGRAGRLGMSAHDIAIATGYSDAHIHRLLMELGRLGSVRRSECHPVAGNSYYIYKDNAPQVFIRNRMRLCRDYAILRLVRGVPALAMPALSGEVVND